MTLDRLYSLAKNARFPIKDGVDILQLLGQNKIEFDGHVMDAEEIAVHIKKYPIRNVSELFRFFLEEEVEAYNLEEAKILGKFETRAES